MSMNFSRLFQKFIGSTQAAFVFSMSFAFGILPACKSKKIEPTAESFDAAIRSPSSSITSTLVKRPKLALPNHMLDDSAQRNLSSKRQERERERRERERSIEANADPLARDFCNALHRMPEERRASCCQTTMGSTTAIECMRVLSTSIKEQSISLEKTEVERCVNALKKSYDGCDWIGPYLSSPPLECINILHGKLKPGQRCISSLECGDLLHCHGLRSGFGAGICGTPYPDEGSCGLTVDTLASYTYQYENLDRKHPECNGSCFKQKCVPLVAKGNACTRSDECGINASCVHGKCANFTYAKVGESCTTLSCERGLECLSNRCIARKPAGAECEADRECIGGCLREAKASKGKCGKRCDAR